MERSLRCSVTASLLQYVASHTVKLAAAIRSDITPLQLLSMIPVGIV
jgi:hypothetical protein